MAAKYLKIFLRFMIGYAVLMGLSGFLMDLSITFPSIAGIPYNVYSCMKILHRNIYLYGIIFNLFPGLIFFIAEKYKPDKFSPVLSKRLFQLWCFFQGVIAIGLLGITLGSFQTSAYMEMEYIPDILIFLTLAGAFGFVISSGLSFQKIPQTRSQSFTWSNFILVPLLVFLFYFAILNFRRPSGLFSSFNILTPYTLNIFEYGFSLYLHNYFLINLAFGVLFFLHAPAGEDDQFFLAIRLQWYIHTLLFLIYLYFQLENFEARDTGYVSKILSLLVYFPYFIGAINLNYLRQPTTQPQDKIIGFVVMFVQIYALGEIVSGVFRFQNLLRFTDWTTAQNHVISLGIILPAVYLLIQSFRGLFPDTNSSPGVPITIWLVAIILLVAANWLTGVYHAAMINKTDFNGFLEFPGWIIIMENLRPFRYARIILDLAVIGLIALFWPRRSSTNSRRQPGAI